MSAIFPKGYSPIKHNKLGASIILPPDVAHELLTAARSELHERMMCIDRAVARAKRKHPKLFQP